MKEIAYIQILIILLNRVNFVILCYLSFKIDSCQKKGYSIAMKNYIHVSSKTGKRKPKRRVRSEAVVILTLGALLLFLVTSMGISVIGKMLFSQDPSNPILSFATPSSDKEIVVIDPGHGGMDTGCNYGEIYEKEITFKIANYMGDYLKANNYEVVYTREDDRMLGESEIEDLNYRVAVSSEEKANYFVSIHLNSTDIESERIYGYEVYANESMEQSMKLGQSVDKELTTLNYTESRGIRDGSSLHVVYMNQNPSVLVEIGYLDDEGDRSFITSEEGMKNLGESLAKAVINTK